MVQSFILDPVVIGLGTALAIAVVSLILSAARSRSLRETLSDTCEILAAERSQGQDLLRRATEAETRLEESRQQLGQTRGDLAQFQAARDEALERARKAERDVALAQQQVEATRAEMANWQKAKEEFLTVTKSTVIQTANELSNRLINDHKRENQITKEESEKRVRETTEKLLQQYEKISNTVHALHEQLGESRSTVDTIQRALSSPGGAGRASETVLENTLKSFDLQEGRDYVLQYSLQAEAGGKLRPDALVFLPGNAVMVIDAKATKHLMDLADAADEQAESEYYARISSTMNNHLKALAAKDYQAAVQQEYRRVRDGVDTPRVFSLMWLPNDGAIEKVQRADPGFLGKASEAKIVVVGPSGLWAAVSIAAQNIQLNRQVENHERIMDGIRIMMERIGTVLDHADGVGKGLKQASDRYAKFAASVNTRLLPGIRRVLNDGLSPPSKGMPAGLPSYQLVETETLVDTDSEPAGPRAIAAPADAEAKPDGPLFRSTRDQVNSSGRG